MTLERGTLLHKRYRIVEILGQGGMGSVYRAVDENLGVDVAVKENLFTTDEYARQFRLEAVILASLRHPNLPRVSDHFAVGDQGQYLVMDFIEGEDLRQRMERMGTVTEEDAVMVGAAMCDALTYLHTRKPSILHRDIKPGNVKITPEGNIFLVDFGLAKLVQGTQATTTGARAMTPGYSPPEQYGTARTDPRTDSYSLGATLYASLSGMIPEDGLARAMDNAQLTPLRKRNPKISRRLAAAIEKAMAVDPADRYQDAEEFKRALLSSTSKTERATGEFTVVPPPDIPAPPSQQSREVRNSARAGGAGGSLLPPMAEDDKPFVPPNKRHRRSSCAWILILLLMIAAGTWFIILNFSPNRFPVNLLASLPFIERPLSTLTTTETATIQPTGTMIEPTATITPTATFTLTPTKVSPIVATDTPNETQIAMPTPFGGGTGQIAFASDRSGIPQIFISDLTGEHVAPITNMPDGACQPVWSPDGLRLVFVSPCKKRVDISEPPLMDTALYIINADGSNLTPLPTAPGGDFEPAWSPDGRRIAFTSLRDGYMQIYSIQLNDLSVTRLTDTAPEEITRQPSWSPINNQIVFAYKRFGAYQIWTMTDTGQGQQQIVRSGQQFWDYLPIWSADDKSVLFTQRSAEGPVLPWAMTISYENRNKAVASRLNLKPLPVEDVHLSPDGLWLVFESISTDNNRDIFYSLASGDQRTQLTKDPGVDFDPAWRPEVNP
jgi:serine/threonine protein kinase/Tol biopolymer transport system component